MTMILVAWAIVLTIILFGDKGLAALQSGKQKLDGRLEARKEKRKAIESHVDEKSGADLAHKIRAAEIEAEMHLQDNGFVLTTCENPDCHTCNPARAVEADVRAHDRKTYAGWPGSRSEYEAYLEQKHRPKALGGITPAGAGAKAGRSKSDYYRLKQDTENLKKDLERIREDYTIVSGAGERIASTMYDYIIVNHQSYPRPSEVPDYADVEIRNYWDENFLVWTWHGNYQGRTVEMYYKQPM